MIRPLSRHRAPLLLATCGALALAACDQPLDMDLRGGTGAFTTADAAVNATTDRPRPDNRGVISYPNYQVAVAQRGDTLNDVAGRVGVTAAELGRYNGIEVNVPLRAGEIIALPRRVAEPSPATGAIGTGPIQASPIDVTTLAGNAIDNSAATTPLPPAPVAQPVAVQTGQEPIRHKVERGETAYTISRLYQVPVRSLAEWNGLNSDFAIREGQFLLIPVAQQAPPKRTVPVTTAPGVGSPTPTPPSAATPLPRDDTAKPAPVATKPAEPVADIGKQTIKPDTNSAMAYPVTGSIIRAYSKGRNEGIDIKANAGTPVKAAAAGSVAAITQSAEGVPIIVVRHPDNLLTVYANVADVAVKKGDAVTRGQNLAKLRAGDDAYLHFEVRKGFESVDPAPYLP
ncbi:peptidoglycan DD-metalloendopeptidase family protein [Pseudosulfitobacter koreensis]|uniref:Peptidoglycan DD-metalloendopeptidase family protein n=1 Tax=Pseudosulfitobacter koreensis TaxID=2968472 RepID=A0ABT1Z044_9RHOB|nr:peptidoglycan DD-metalloendopeptidase family protein [Pseudosulfitobacter koreense]MCR8826498.1 peptidoglycan DD-metalloendopeptidase family protein [Pseudosulfitobacter koreense]